MRRTLRAAHTTCGARIPVALASIAAVAVCLLSGGSTARAAGPRQGGQRSAWIYKHGGSNAGQMRRGAPGDFNRGRTFRHRHEDRDNDLEGMFPHWTRTLTRDGVDYEVTTIGSDPRRGSKTTTIPVMLIPLRFEFPDGTVNDGTDPVAGKPPIEHILASPVFTPGPFSSNGVSLGTTQWVDAYARASLWDDVERRAKDYHVLLSPTVAPKQTITVAPEDWWAAYDDGRGIWVNAPSIPSATLAMTSILRQLQVPTDTMAVFVAGDVPLIDTVQLAWALGLYTTTADQADNIAPNAMAIVDFLDAGQWYDISPDSTVIAHELLHWLTNPYFDGEISPWVEPYVSGNPAWCSSDVYNVVDPVQFLQTIAPPAMAPYHLPEALMARWFTHQSARQARTGISFWGTQASVGTPCISDDAIDYRYFDAQPGALSTWPIDLNNEGDIVGYYYDGQAKPHGFVRRDGRTRTVDMPGAARTYVYATSDTHEIAGAYFKATGLSHGFYSSNGRLQSFDVPGAAWTYISSIGSTGRLGGSYQDASGAAHGFIYERGRLTTLDVPGAATTYLNAFNDVGDIALSGFDAAGAFMGSWVRHGLYGTSTLVSFPGDTSETSISNLDNRGRVIGSFIVNGRAATDGFVMKEDGTFLRLLVYQASSINDDGDMIGTKATDGHYRGFVAKLPGRNRNMEGGR